MLITSSVIELKEGGFPKVEGCLADIPGLELRGVSKDLRRLLLIIETEDSEELEKISGELRKHPDVFSLLHHSFYFENL